MGIPLRVLIIEDSEDDARLLVHELLKAGFEPDFERVETSGAMAAALDRAPWDIVLADYKMPQFSGLQALALLQAKGEDIPFILISGTIGEDTAVEAVRSGAQDYILKDNLVRLAPAIRRELEASKVRQERKKAEEKARILEHQFRGMLEDIQLIAVLMDVNGNITFCNKYLLDLAGYSRQEALGKNWFDMFLPADVRAVIKPVFYEKVTSGKMPLQYENDIVTRQGERRTILWNNIALLDSEQHIVGTASIGQDITERKRMEESLLTATEKMKILIGSSPLAIIILNVEGTVQFWNPAAERLFGWKEKEVLGQPLLMVPEEEWDSFKEVHKRAVQGEELVGLEFRPQRKDKMRVDVSLAVAPLKDSKGEITGAVGFIMDISERKKAEKEIKDKIEEIEKLNKFMMGREKRIIELKREVDEVLRECGKPLKYKA